jgi:putative addiction module killer protein
VHSTRQIWSNNPTRGSTARSAAGNPGDVKPVGGGISELRIDYGPGYRVCYQQRGDVLVVLLHGGDKSSQAKDITRARELAKEWADNGQD